MRAQAGGATLTARALHRHLAEIVLGAHSDMLADRVLVEPRIVAHPVFRNLWEVALVVLHQPGQAGDLDAHAFGRALTPPLASLIR